MLPPLIASEDLTPAMVPDPDTADTSAIWAFFHSFDGYGRWGGALEAHRAVQAAAEIVHAQYESGEVPEDGFARWPEPALDLIRTDAFLELRADRHMGREVSWDAMRQVLRLLLWTMAQNPK